MTIVVDMPSLGWGGWWGLEVVQVVVMGGRAGERALRDFKSYCFTCQRNWEVALAIACKKIKNTMSLVLITTSAIGGSKL